MPDTAPVRCGARRRTSTWWYPDRIRDSETKSGMRPFYAAVDRVEVVEPLTARIYM